MRLFLFSCLLFWVSVLNAQTEIQEPIIKTPNMPAGPLPSTAVSNVTTTSGSVTYTAEQEVVLTSGPNSSDVFTAMPSESNYFLARIGAIVYAELKDILDASYVQTLGSKLSFRYEEKYQDGNLSYQIYKSDRTPMVALPYPTNYVFTKVVGSNFYTIDLKDITGLIPSTENSYYILEVTNSKGEITKLRFKYTL